MVCKVVIDNDKKPQIEKAKPLDIHFTTTISQQYHTTSQHHNTQNAPITLVWHLIKPPVTTMGSVRRGHNKTKTKLTRDNNGKFGRTAKRTGSKAPEKGPEKATGVLQKRTRDPKKKRPKDPVKQIKPSRVSHKHHITSTEVVSDEKNAENNEIIVEIESETSDVTKVA